MKLGSALLAALLCMSLAALMARDQGSVGVDRPGEGTGGDAARAAWSEVRWPFPLDAWGSGRAFHCAAAECDIDVNLYLRAKVGFCNCTTGIADNDDLDRVSDLELFSDRFAGLTDGRAISIGHMSGRSRLYHVAIPYAQARDMLAIGFNDKCDVAVATVVADRDRLDLAERVALEFLNSDLVLHWAATELAQNGI
jgi:hypothetical protein